MGGASNGLWCVLYIVQIEHVKRECTTINQLNDDGGAIFENVLVLYCVCRWCDVCLSVYVCVVFVCGSVSFHSSKWKRVCVVPLVVHAIHKIPSTPTHSKHTPANIRGRREITNTRRDRAQSPAEHTMMFKRRRES